MPERVTRSAAETEALGVELAATLAPGDLLLLAGELGAGKTTFVRGLARGLGSTATVQSPTFTLVRVYPGRVQLAHVDLYRLEKSAELADLGLEELLEAGVVAVEWGDRLAFNRGGGRAQAPPSTAGRGDLLPSSGRVIRVAFEHRSQNERVVSLP